MLVLLMIPDMSPLSLVLALALLTPHVTSPCRRQTPQMYGPVSDAGNRVPHGVRLVLVEQARLGTPMPLMMELGPNAPPQSFPAREEP